MPPRAKQVARRVRAEQPRVDMCDQCGIHPTCGMSVSYNGSWPPTHLCRPCYDAETTATDNEISNQRAAELTAARAEIARLQAENARLPALSRNIIGRNVYQDLRDVYSTLNDFDLSSDEARRRVLLFLHGMSTQNGWGWAAPRA